MLIELALLPPTIAEQVKQVQYGTAVQFVENDKAIANLSQANNNFLSFYTNTPFDVADIDLPEFDRSLNKFDDPFGDD